MKIQAFTLLSALVFLMPACDGGDDDMGSGSSGDNGSGGQLQTGEGPCDSASDCAGDVCAAIPGDDPALYCSQPCDGGCPSGFYCDNSTFALAGIDFCRPSDDPAMPPEQPPVPEEPPTLPCQDDADCESGLVCATWMGDSACSVPCTVEEDCTPPSVGGLVVDLLTCGTDDDGREVCVPDLACYPNVWGCIETPGLP